MLKMYEGIQLSNLPQFICDRPQPAKEYNYNQSTLIWMPRNELHNHCTIHMLAQTNVFVR